MSAIIVENLNKILSKYVFKDILKFLFYFSKLKIHKMITISTKIFVSKYNWSKSLNKILNKLMIDWKNIENKIILNNE